MTVTQIMFYIFATIIVVFSVLTVTSRRILRAATYLLFVLVSTSGLYFMLNFQFLAAVQLTLYVGGIVVLIIFSILLTSHINQKFEPVKPSKIIYGLIASISGLVLCLTTVLQYEFKASTLAAQEINMRIIGKSLLSYEKDGYALPFEVISVLLLAAMIAAIVIAKRNKKSTTTDNNKQ